MLRRKEFFSEVKNKILAALLSNALNSSDHRNCSTCASISELSSNISSLACTKVVSALSMLSHLALSINSSANFFVYVAWGSKFRYEEDFLDMQYSVDQVQIVEQLVFRYYVSKKSIFCIVSIS